MLLRLGLAESIGDGDEIGNSEQSDRVLVVRGEFAVKGNDVGDDILVLTTRSDGLCERLYISTAPSSSYQGCTHPERLGSSTSDHGRIVVA